MIKINKFVKRIAVFLIISVCMVSMCCYAENSVKSTVPAEDTAKSSVSAEDTEKSSLAGKKISEGNTARNTVPAEDTAKNTVSAEDSVKSSVSAETEKTEGNKNFFSKIEDTVKSIDIKAMDEKLSIKGLDSSNDVSVSKEFIYIAIIVGILLVALCIVFLALAAGNSSKVKQLERDKQMLKEEEAQSKFREEQLARRLMENQQQNHDKKWLIHRADIDDNDRGGYVMTDQEQRHLEAARYELIEILKKIAHRKRLEALCLNQETLLEEQPWLRADRN